MVSKASSAVARVAYLASDVLVDSRLSSSSTSAFGSTYHQLSSGSNSKPIVSLPFGADPGTSLVQHASKTVNLISYTATSHSQLLHRLVLHLSELASAPLVLHIAIPPTEDLSDVLVLRASVPFFVYSRTPQEAHDHALLASRLAWVERKPVVHAFVDSVGAIDEVAEDRVQPFLLTQTDAAVNGHILPPSDYPEALYQSYEEAAHATSTLLTRRIHSITGPHSSPTPAHTVIFSLGPVALHQHSFEGVTIVDVSLASPLPAAHVARWVPTDATSVLVLEQVGHWPAKWTPVYLDIVAALQQREAAHYPSVQSVFFDVEAGTPITQEELANLLTGAASSSTSTRLRLTSSAPSHPPTPVSSEIHIPKHETSYLKLLDQLFGARLEISNSPSLIATAGPQATTPEFAVGRIRGQVEQRAALVSAVQELLSDFAISEELHGLLAQWLDKKDDGEQSRSLGEQIVQNLEGGKDALSNASTERVLALQAYFPALSRWIVGSDAWAYDLGASGLHHAIASRLNVNILVLDSVPYSARNLADPSRRKQDVGLYAMNYGDVYVASVAIYSSYAQTLHALTEADKFQGPSVVVAYLPYKTEDTPALEVLKETKCAVDAGYWPLYRWNPSKEANGQEPFTLDSDAVKRDLQAFLDRQNHLSQLVRSKPQLAAEIVGSLGENLKEARRNKAKNAYQDLLNAIDAPPLLILYGSDGGKAEKVARRLANRGKMRGLSTTAATMDSYSVEDLAKEEYVVFITSVAGQGEFPQNARAFVKTLNGFVARSEQPFTRLKYAVFGMGDSHYWPRPEDKGYYNKAGKTLDARLAELGGERAVPLALGDDQDADGPETGYKAWEPLVWKLLGVDNVEVNEADPEPITNEHIKAASQYLRGTIVEGLEDTTTGAMAESDQQLTKFHGTYQQDDRDIRDERIAAGVEPAYGFMIRVRMPGGVCTPEQWLVLDRIADEHGNGTFKITTRQTFQFHGVIKRHLKQAMQDINRTLLDTLAACGDVNR